jgi:two-component system response regulator GlrR
MHAAESDVRLSVREVASGHARLAPVERAEHGIGEPYSPAGAIEASAPQGERELSLALHGMVGQDPAFRAMLERIPRIAADDGTVLITGETGTGKELSARAIHGASRRAHHPFVAVDCGAFPEHLLENELFGHARGAFTDARGDQKGLARVAEGGTLFLDEIDALSLTAQAKLLRFLQERSFKPLGAERFVNADVRVIVATNRDLDALVAERRFRSDLFFRLNVLPVRLPPLRERRGDIALIAEHFLAMLNQGRSGPARSLSAGAIERLYRHDWPGNVRELQNVVRRAVVMMEPERSEIRVSELSLPAECALEAPSVTSFREAKARALAAFERAFVRELLERTHGNITEAARQSKQDRRAFGRLVKKHNLVFSAP